MNKTLIATLHKLVAFDEADIVYHGTNSKPLDKRISDNSLKSYDSLGLWLTGSKDAAKFFGPNIYEYEDPAGYLALYDPREDEFRKAFYNDEVSRRVNGKTLSKYLKIYSEGDQSRPSLLLKTDRSVDAYHRFIDKAGLSNEYKSDMSQLFREKIYTNPKYLAAFRANLESAGYEGIFWPLSSIDVDMIKTINLHNVYVIFDPSKMKKIP